jgi:two-component system response regulator HydG
LGKNFDCNNIIGEKGSFTGASRNKEGKFQQADKGSIFLDEISETSTAMQVKLLRTLQEREVTPVGSEKVVKVDTRIIAATNKDLIDLISKGDFREDLYYRLNVINLRVPPLRERTGDVQILAQHFLKEYAAKNNRNIKGFTPEAVEKMVGYHWPGNVRELMNTLERSVILSNGDFLGKEDIQIEVSTALRNEFDPGTDQINVEGKTLYEVEKLTILKMLDTTGNNKSETARQLGISRRTLHLKLKDYGVMP